MTEELLQLKNIYKNFGNVKVLKDVNIKINKGEVVAILGGANGVFVSIAVIAVALDVKDSVMLWGFMASLLLYSLVRQRIAPR